MLRLRKKNDNNDRRLPKVKEREIRSLLKAGVEFQCKQMIVVTNDYEKTEQHSWFGYTGEIEFIPLWKWLERAELSISNNYEKPQI